MEHKPRALTKTCPQIRRMDALEAPTGILKSYSHLARRSIRTHFKFRRASRAQPSEEISCAFTVVCPFAVITMRTSGVTGEGGWWSSSRRRSGEMRGCFGSRMSRDLWDVGAERTLLRVVVVLSICSCLVGEWADFFLIRVIAECRFVQPKTLPYLIRNFMFESNLKMLKNYWILAR